MAIAFERAAVVVAKALASFRLSLDADDPFAYTENELLEAGYIVGRLWAEGLLNTAGETWVSVESENIANITNTGGAGMKSVIEFLDRIEGSGYGGMADFECARTDARDAAAEIERLTGENRCLHDTKNWHIKAEGEDLLICVGDHKKKDACEFHRYRYVDPERE